MNWAGSLPGWATLFVLLLGVWRISRGGGGSAVSELKTANEVLTTRLDTYKEENTSLRQEIAELRGRTDVTLALAPILELAHTHEKRAQERHDGSMIVLDLIARRLGPDPVDG